MFVIYLVLPIEVILIWFISVYGVFLHLKDKKFTDFEAIKQEIIDETLREPGPSGFSSKPINLKIYAPNGMQERFYTVFFLLNS